jgi:putative Mn2+ efflux pump MntP
MGIIEALVLALALCVDSLVVSATTAFREKISYRRGLLMALIFGLCQGGFPLMGALIGDVAREFIEAVDHWVAFGLLAFVGGKMVVEGIRGKEESAKQRPLTVATMFLLGTATSIDAFAVGIGLGLDNPMRTVLMVVAMIAAVTVVVSLVGVYLGKRNIPVPERTANIIAGLVLVGLGAKILLEHLLG